MPWPIVNHAPRVPTDVEIPDLDTFSRSPGPMLILRRKRKPMRSVYCAKFPATCNDVKILEEGRQLVRVAHIP